MGTPGEIIDWLLKGDPAIRWQALAQFSGAPAGEVAAERARVAREGWGAALLSRQRADGSWGEGEAEDRGWMITIRTLTLLKDMGADAQDPAVRAAMAGVKPLRFAWHDNRLFLDGESEACLNGRILGIGAAFDEPSPSLLGRLLGEQLPDGGWNCDAPPSTRASFHSTICVLEGLLAHEAAKGPDAAVGAARARAEEYLLARQLHRRLGTGEVIDEDFRRFAFHPNWRYDVLRALDYFRAAGRRPDARMGEAIEIVRAHRGPDGRWPLDRLEPGPIGYVTEAGEGRPSRWNTLRALRVLDWWEGR
jgi:hypothetical protein